MKITIIPLGTVSPYCKNEKNCPGFLIKYGNHKILLDCGNGITRMLNLPDDLDNLNIIISHLHKDHYGDLLSLGYASYVYHNLDILNEKINLYIPDYDSCEKISDADFLNNFGSEQFFNFNYYTEDSCFIIDDLKITFSLNPHSILTYSIKLETPQESIVYSGDTGFNNNCLECFAKGVDLLICESTFLKGQLRSKDEHLYAYEAATIAKNADVGKLVLTHFWPEIDKVEYIKEAKEIFENTIAAVEGQKIELE